MPARRTTPPLLAAVASATLIAVTVAAAACAGRSAASPAADAALADTLTRRITDAYDFGKPDVVGRLMALYPARGPLVSAAAGGVTTSRAALQAEITRFWERVGQNMQHPRFVIGERHLTRLGPDAAALTLTYSIPHHTPEGLPHTLAGAWTAVFQRQEGRWVIVQEHLSDPPRPAAAPTADSAHAHGGTP
jgi:hypothetical protein